MKRVLLILAVFMSAPALADNHAEVVAEVKAAMEGFNEAYATNDVDAYFSYYTEDAALFFFGERHKVSDYYDEWKATVESGFKYEKYELSDVRIQILSGGAVAVATFFVDLSSPTPEGAVADSRAFESEVWEKIDGEWKIVTLHYTEI